MTSQPDLFGNDNPRFDTARERYGQWPITVWDIDYSDSYTKNLKTGIGDIGTQVAQGYLQTRAGSFTTATDDASVYRGKVVASVFSPAVAQYTLNMFAPTEPANVYDPFGGGGTRAIMAAAAGHQYLGVEIRADETEQVRKRVEANGYADRALVVTGDSRQQHAPDAWADFLYTCPPYYDLEEYGGPDGDLSMSGTYNDFLNGITDVVERSARILKPGATACWVVGLHREPDGTLLPLHHAIARIHTDTGYTYREEVVLRHVNNGAIQRVGLFEKGNRRLVRTHEYLLVFTRGAA